MCVAYGFIIGLCAAASRADSLLLGHANSTKLPHRVSSPDARHGAQGGRPLFRVATFKQSYESIYKVGQN